MHSDDVVSAYIAIRETRELRQIAKGSAGSLRTPFVPRHQSIISTYYFLVSWGLLAMYVELIYQIKKGPELSGDFGYCSAS
jgi:hypothetical protein